MALKTIQKRISTKKQRPYGLSKKDWHLTMRIAAEDRITLVEAARHVKRYRVDSKKMCPDY